MSFTEAHFQTSDHVDLHYKTGKLCNSNVPALFFCHGVGGNPQQFKDQHEFTEEYCVVLPALRGHGNSAMPAEINGESLSLLRNAVDMLELADHLGIQEFHFVGHSIGGLIGLELLKIAPERLLSLSIFGVSPCPKKSVFPDWLRANVSHFASYNQLERILGYKKTFDPNTWNDFKQMLKGAHRAAVYYMLRSMIRHNYLKTLETNSHIPILLMRSEGDDRVNQSLDPCLGHLEQLRNIDIMRIGSASHLINMETPEFFNQILSSFLTKVKLKEHKLNSISIELPL